MINPALYSALRSVFGVKNVHPVKQGQRGNFKFGYRTRVRAGKTEDYRTICKVTQGARTSVGEEFKVPCPFCHDHLPRLYINNLWGTKDTVTGSRYLWMANCYNEGCMSFFEKRKKLFEMVSARMDLNASLNEGVEPRIPESATWPGEMWPLYDVVKRDSNHPASRFCFARTLDPQELTQMYDVRVVIEPDYWPDAMRDRIVAPVYSGSKDLKTWTARRVLDDDSPKWLHCPYIGTGNSIYGLKSAKQSKLPAIVEGPIDVYAWRGRAAGVFGKVVQEAKARRLAKAFKDATAIILALDSEQELSDRLNGNPHHMTIAEETIKQFTTVPIVKLWLPLGRDPGSLDYDILEEHTKRCADEQRIKL